MGGEEEEEEKEEKDDSDRPPNNSMHVSPYLSTTPYPPTTISLLRQLSISTPNLV